MRLPVNIDGSHGEGGGQVLRTSLALAIITGRKLRMKKIRAGRKRPGLQAQHLACVMAAARLCNGTARACSRLAARPSRSAVRAGGGGQPVPRGSAGLP